jgi:hypothetical protein
LTELRSNTIFSDLKHHLCLIHHLIKKTLQVGSPASRLVEQASAPLSKPYDTVGTRSRTSCNAALKKLRTSCCGAIFLQHISSKLLLSGSNVLRSQYPKPLSVAFKDSPRILHKLQLWMCFELA